MVRVFEQNSFENGENLFKVLSDFVVFVHYYFLEDV